MVANGHLACLCGHGAVWICCAGMDWPSADSRRSTGNVDYQVWAAIGWVGIFCPSNLSLLFCSDEGAKMKSVVDRFLDKISPEPNTGCWLWTASLDHHGYGQFNNGHTMVKAHRFCFSEIAKRHLPSDLTLDHLCRVRSCVNPDHLEPVTLSENGKRGLGAASLNRSKTHCKNGHKFDAANTRITLERGNIRRKCRACHCAGVKKSYRRNKMFQVTKVAKP